MIPPTRNTYQYINHFNLLGLKLSIKNLKETFSPCSHAKEWNRSNIMRFSHFCHCLPPCCLQQLIYYFIISHIYLYIKVALFSVDTQMWLYSRFKCCHGCFLSVFLSQSLGLKRLKLNFNRCSCCPSIWWLYGGFADYICRNFVLMPLSCFEMLKRGNSISTL